MDAFNQPIIRELLDDYPFVHLDAGKPRESIRSRLQALTVESLFEPREVNDRAMAACCLSALWLWHNYLDESHKISQEIETSAGSAWHGIMHRREGDFWNANYWFARVRENSLFSGVRQEIPVESDRLPENLQRLADAKQWSPTAFTDAVQGILKSKDEFQITAALRLAAAEWRALFRVCWMAATS